MPGLEFRLRKIDETRNYVLDEMKNNDLMSKKYKRTYKYLNYVEQLRILVSTVTGCASISAFAWLVCLHVCIVSSEVGLKICVITARIKKYRSIMKKKKEKHDNIKLLGKSKSDTIAIFISKS